MLHGVALPPHYGGLTLHQLVHGEGLPPLRLSAPDVVDVPVGPDRTLACWGTALLLVEDDGGRYVVLVRGQMSLALSRRRGASSWGPACAG